MCLSQGAAPAERGGLQNYLWLQAERIGLAGGAVPGGKTEDGAVHGAWLCPSSHHSGSQTSQQRSISCCKHFMPPCPAAGISSCQRQWDLSRVGDVRTPSLAGKGASFSLIMGRDFISWFHPRSPCNKGVVLWVTCMQSFPEKQHVQAGAGKSPRASLDQQETFTGASLPVAELTALPVP